MIWAGRYIEVEAPGEYTWVRCANCARLLTDPESCARGVGPDCLREHGEEHCEEQKLVALEHDRELWRDRRGRGKKAEDERRERADREQTRDVLRRETKVTKDGMRVDRETGAPLGPVLGWTAFTPDQREHLMRHGVLPRVEGPG